jgi:hypothetical protein
VKKQTQAQLSARRDIVGFLTAFCAILGIVFHQSIRA